MSEDNVKDMSTEWKEISPGIYARPVPMNKRKATLETLEELEAAGVEIPCEVYSRVVGYLRPVSAWNAAKQQEFKERKVFKHPEAEGEA